MAKYSNEFKIKVLKEYNEGKGSIGDLCRKYGIANKSTLGLWIRKYNTGGEEKVFRSRKKEEYSFQFKLNVVRLYLSGEASYRELAIAEGMKEPSLICQWVNAFRDVGPEALRPRKKGRKKTLKKANNKSEKINEERKVDTSAEHVKELEDELLKLQIENAYLKELRRMRLEEEALQKRQQESSTVSEDHSN